MNEGIEDNTAAALAVPPPAAANGVPFAQLNLRPEVLRALSDMGFSAAMDVQSKTLPVVRSGRDLMVQSRTGSGKTAAFGIPIADGVVVPEDKHVQAIILLPTRELALQVAAELARIVAHLDVTVVPVYGGAPMGRQIEQLKAGGQIVCGTPGRILDHLRRGTLQLDRVKCAVLDECDEMLSMGFQEDIEAILERTPAERQTLLFSATVPEGIQRLAKRFMRNPEHLKLSADFVGVHQIRHVYYSVPGAHREGDLVRILEFENPRRGIVFCNTREETGRVAEYLRGKGLEADAISSDLSQTDRERVMGRMRAGELRFLVATDVAARGIDLENLSHVFNFTFPDSPEVYIHRTGRTGRAGRDGTAVSLIGPTEVGAFYYLKLLYKIKPEERSLPSEIEIRSKREGEFIQTLRKEVTSDPGAPWRSLARRLMGTVDAEKLLGGLLRDRLSRPSAPVAPVIAAVAPPVAAVESAPTEVPVERAPRSEVRSDRPGRYDRAERGNRFDRGERADGRGRGPRPESPRPRRDDVRSGGPTPEARRDGARGEERALPREGLGRDNNGVSVGESAAPAAVPERTAEAVVSPPAAATPVPAAAAPVPRARAPRGGASAGEGEFWDVWRDETPTVPEVSEVPAAGPSAGQARLYLNLGRKDGASPESVAALVKEAADATPDELDVMNTHTYLNVPSAAAERVVAALNGRDYNGRRLLCETARPRRR